MTEDDLESDVVKMEVHIYAAIELATVAVLGWLLPSLAFVAALVLAVINGGQAVLASRRARRGR